MNTLKLSVKIVYAILTCLWITLTGCTKEPEPIIVDSVTLSPSAITITEGESQTLKVTITPSDAENKNVTWTSSNTEVATVAEGKVTALKAGKTTITVTTEDGAKTATCEVTVKAKIYPVTGVTLDKTEHEMTEDEEVTLNATVNPDNATNKNVTWTSSNTEVATVAEGKVTALKAGKTTITVTTEDGAKTATCEVTVKAKTLSTEEDEGNLNYGENGGAGDNIDEENDIYDGGSF